LKKVWIWCAFFAFFVCLTPLSAAAVKDGGGAEALDVGAEADAIKDDLANFMGAMPPEVAELLPPELFSEDMAAVGEATRQASAPSAVLEAVGRVTGLELGANLALLAGICGVLLLSAVFRAMRVSGGTDTGRALSFCATLSLCLVIISLQRTRFFEIASLFSVLRELSAALVPMMGALYAMGGSVAAAVANHGIMSAFLAVLETVIAGTVLPVAGICLCLGLLDALSGKGELRSLAVLIKRTYTWCFSLLMLLLCGTLGMQSTLAKGSDGLAMRTVRFAAGSFLPVVGGSISEALRTVTGSVAYLRSVAGMAAVLALFFLFLPVFVSLLLNRIVFLLGGAMAKLMGCDGEEKLLAELASVYGYFLAVIASLFVTMTFSLTLMARCAVAGGGI
jgi:stage III sporulation protein AE